MAIKSAYPGRSQSGGLAPAYDDGVPDEPTPETYIFESGVNYTFENGTDYEFN